MALPEFLTRSRPRYRTAAIALGVAFALYGVILGLTEHFTNWGVVTFLSLVGLVLVAAGTFLSEHYLQRAAVVLLILGTISASVKLLGSLAGSP